VNLQTFEGLAKVGGTIVCVSGAILMVLYRGPSLIGYTELIITPQSEIKDLGIDNFQLGVVFLIGNCMCMAAFLAIQVSIFFVMSVEYF
jgi:hypothetical protein